MRWVASTAEAACLVWPTANLNCAYDACDPNTHKKLRAMPSWTSRATQNDEMLAVARVWLRDRVLPRVLMLVACARGRPAPLPAETAD